MFKYTLKSLVSMSTLALLMQFSLAAADNPQTNAEETQSVDGPTVQTQPDGSKLIRRADGTTIQIKLDGTKIVKKPDGTTVQINPDGSKNIKRANGTSIQIETERTK